MKHHINLQIATKQKNIPTKTDFKNWTKAAILKNIISSKIGVRIVDEPEMLMLNETYRKKKGPTNVLSFDYRDLNETNIIFGDIVICAPIVEKEAKEQNKDVRKHFAHMAVHGCLHLQGFDHQTEKQTKIMEQLESQILSQFDATFGV
ncbi:MAG: rRNA maturation RNase YbeY [Gammaproteobacteria bacterium]|nr:rRNA maturation RNase YbeY [Gammaproteobacteria bacterium]